LTAVLRPLLCAALLAVSTVVSLPARADAQATAATILAAHDWRTTIALGNRYLKQQALLAVRAELAARGRSLGLGKSWRMGDAQWDAAEAALMEALIPKVRAEWTTLDWLKPEWTAMALSSFTPAELDAIAAHFATEVGHKQAKILDQNVAFHAGGALTMSGKLIGGFPGTEEEQKTLTYVYAEEDKAMRFSVAANDNIEGQRFALSDLGAKYQKALVIKVTGIFGARMDKVAASLPAAARAQSSLADPFIAGFRAANPG
jgi:hypothetical protein